MIADFKKTTIKSWVIWFLAALFYFYEYMIQVSPGVMAKELMKTFNISGFSLGSLSAYYFYSYASMQLIVGLLLDRLGPRKLITISSILCSLGCLLFSQATTIYHAEISRIIIGIGSACAVISTFKLATQWFEKEMFGFISGLTITVGMTGAICGEVPLEWLMSIIGWRPMMELFAGGGVIISILIFAIVEDTPSHVKKIKNTAPFLQSLKQVLSCKQTWITSIYGGLMFAPTTALGALWGVSWMCTYYGFTRTQSAHIVSFLFLGWAIGGPLSGILTRYFRKCKTTMVYGSLLNLIILLALIYIQSWSVSALAILWFFLGVGSSGFLPFMTIIKNLHPDYNVGTAMSFGNAMNMVGGALLQPFIGFILDYLWDGTVIAGVRNYSAVNFTYALSVMPLLSLIALYVLSCIKENFSESHPENNELPAQGNIACS